LPRCTTNAIRVTGAIDYSHPNDLAERIHVGAEFAYDEMFFVRSGVVRRVIRTR
jgi:hypothetical protein